MQIIDILYKNMNYNKRIQWHIAGTGPMTREIQDFTKNRSNISLHGHLKYDEMICTFDKCDILVSTSKWESFGNSIAEAQCLGLPVIAYNYGGPVDIVTKNSGFLVNDAYSFVSALKKYLDSEIKFDKKTISKQTIDRFDVNIVSKKYLSIFDAVLESK